MWELSSPPTPRRTSLRSLDASATSLLEDNEIRQLMSEHDGYSIRPICQESELEHLGSLSLNEVSIRGED